MLKVLAITVSLSLLSLNLFASDSANPPVKKSNTGICHPKGGTYYEQTKHFTPFKTMEECIKSGGRTPKK
jgi:hypothetical protein